MFQNDNRKISLSDLLQADRRLITREQYLSACQRIFTIRFSDEPEPELTRERKRDKQLIEDYEREHPEKKALHGVNITVLTATPPLQK